MSLWQFSACIDGYNRSQGKEDPIEAITPEDYFDMIERLG